MMKKYDGCSFCPEDEVFLAENERLTENFFFLLIFMVEEENSFI